MTAIYLGSRTLGDAIPGLSDSLDTVGNGLDLIRDTVGAAVGQLNAITGQLQGLVDDYIDAVGDLAAAALAPALNLLQQARDYLDQLNAILDPNAYLGAVIAQVSSALALLQSLTGSDYLDNLLDGANAAISSAEALVNSITEPLGALNAISDGVASAIGALDDVVDNLQGALNDTLDAINTYVEQASQLLNAGVHAIEYTGNLDQMGSEIDSAALLSGLGPNTPVTGPLLFVASFDTATVAALKAAFGL